MAVASEAVGIRHGWIVLVSAVSFMALMSGQSSAPAGSEVGVAGAEGGGHAANLSCKKNKHQNVCYKSLFQ